MVGQTPLCVPSSHCLPPPCRATSFAYVLSSQMFCRDQAPLWPEGESYGPALAVANLFSLPVTREERLCQEGSLLWSPCCVLPGPGTQLGQDTFGATAAASCKPAGWRAGAATVKMGPGRHSRGSKPINLLTTQPPSLLKYEITFSSLFRPLLFEYLLFAVKSPWYYTHAKNDKSKQFLMRDFTNLDG